MTRVLLEQGLVDEVLLLVYPVLLGRGKRFFSDSADPRELALVSTKAGSSGVLMNTYRPVGSLRTESSPRRAAELGAPELLESGHADAGECPAGGLSGQAAACSALGWWRGRFRRRPLFSSCPCAR